MEKVIHRTARAFKNKPTKQNVSSRARRRVYLCYILMQAIKERGCIRIAEGKPPPAWFSTRFVDLFVNAIN